MSRLGLTRLSPELSLFALGLVLVVAAAWQSISSPRMVLAGTAGVVFVALAASNLLAGVVVFSFVAFPDVLPDIAGASTVAKPAGLVLAVSWVLLVLSKRGDVPFLPRDEPVLAALAGGLVAWAAASVMWASSQGEATSYLMRLVQVVVLFMIVYTALRSLRDVRVLVWALLAAAFVTALYGLATGSYTTDGRLHGIFDANYLAAHLAAYLALGGFLLAVTKRRAAQLVLAAMLVTYCVAFALTQSRGGLVALAAAAVVAIAYAGRFRPHAVVVALSIVALGVAYYGVVAAVEVRERVTDFSAEGSAGRTDQLKIATSMIRDHPVLGVGVGNYTVEETRYLASDFDVLVTEYVLDRRLEAHNTFLQAAAELGIPGLVLYLAFIAVALSAGVTTVRRLERAGDEANAILVRGMVVATVALLVAYVFFSGLVEKPFWMLLGALVAARALSTAGEKASPESSVRAAAETQRRRGLRSIRLAEDPGG